MNTFNGSSSFCRTPIQDIAFELSSQSTDLSSLFLKLKEVAPPPSDLVGLKLAIVGAAKSTAVANQCLEGLLKTPIKELQEFSRQFNELELQCHLLFEEKTLEDSVTLARRRLSPTPSWKLLTLIGAQRHTDTALTAATGILLIRALIIDKPMSTGLCKSLCTADLQEAPGLLIAGLMQPALDIESAQMRRLSGNLMELLALITKGKFEVERKDFNQLVQESWSCRAAFPTINCRSAILDSHCLSHHQVEMLAQSKSVDIFDSPETRKVAIFLAEFTGLAPIHLPSIPLGSASDPESVSHNISIDLEHGVLIKNYKILCVDVSQFKTDSDDTASYVFCQPLPGCVHTTLFELHKGKPNAETVGELIPKLADISNRQPVFSSIAGFAPSWAKLRFSVAPYLRQKQINALLAALLTADFGATLKSKLYYCRVDPQEIHEAANRAYAMLGFKTCGTSTLQVPFGTNALTTDEELLGVDLLLATQAALSAPANNSSVEKLLAHHNHLTLYVGFRVSLGCALRESRILPVISGYAEHTYTFAVDEKAPESIEGHLEALVPATLRELLLSYKTHCSKLAKRLQKKHVNTAFTARLLEIETKAEAPLFQLACQHGTARALSTTDILKACAPTKLAPDFGRKWAENALRRAGMRSADIDRVLRHEGRGQEAMSSAADGSFPSWANRAGAILERALMAVVNYADIKEGGSL